jgi:hypothetical protein
LGRRAVRSRLAEIRRIWRHTVVGAFLFWLYTSQSRLAFALTNETGAVGDCKIAYGASSNLTVTGLASLASSSTWVAGWESDAVDNTSSLYKDFRVTAKITAGTTLTAGELRMYIVGMLDDSTWPDVFDGTGSAETVTNTAIRDAVCRLGCATATTTTNSVVYFLDCPSVATLFNNHMPKKFVVFITHSMVGALAAAGHQVTVVGSYETIQLS